MSNTPSLHVLFVYGTLREAKKATHILEGYEMFSISDKFPAIKKGDGTVYGGILVANDQELAMIDEYEGIAFGLYTRQFVEVKEITTGKSIKVQAYIGENVFPKVISSGDWLKQ